MLRNTNAVHEKCTLFSMHFSFWLIPIMSHHFVYDIECSSMFYIRCEMLPGKVCEGVPLNYDSYAIDIASRPQLMNFVNLLKMLYKQFRHLPACGLFLGLSMCLAEFPPCNADVNRLQVICESGCARYSQLLTNCIGTIISVSSSNSNFTQFGEVDALFDCFDPGSYLPSVSASLYDEQSCYDLFGSQDKFTCE